MGAGRRTWRVSENRYRPQLRLCRDSEMKLENVLQRYIIEYQRLAVLQALLHAVTRRLKSRKDLVINGLLCYINDNGPRRELPGRYPRGVLRGFVEVCVGLRRVAGS